MAYCTASDVAALTRNLLGSASEFEASTSPTSTQITAWLSTGCAAVESKVGGTIAATSYAYGLAQQANALFAAWMAERSRINTRVATDERTRAEMFKNDFDAIMEILADLDDSDLGISNTATSAAWAGGISISDRDVYTTDSDRVKPRFSRGQFGDGSDLSTVVGAS